MKSVLTVLLSIILFFATYPTLAEYVPSLARSKVTYIDWFHYASVFMVFMVLMGVASAIVQLIYYKPRKKQFARVEDDDHTTARQSPSPSGSRKGLKKVSIDQEEPRPPKLMDVFGPEESGNIATENDDDSELEQNRHKEQKESKT